MENKRMPVVGKKYKCLQNGEECKVVYLNKRNAVLEHRDNDIGVCRPEIFFDKIFGFEELPEDRAEAIGAKNAQVEIKPETQSHISELSSEVKEAMEELRKEQSRVLPTSGYYNSGVRWHSCYNNLLDKTKDLLNALDKQNRQEKSVSCLAEQASKSCCKKCGRDLDKNRRIVWDGDYILISPKIS